MLTVRGRYLEGAELRAATSEEYLILQPEKQTQVYPNGIEEWRCYSPIVLSNKPIHIFASREVCVDNRYLTVRSEPCPMVDNTLRTRMHSLLSSRPCPLNFPMLLNLPFFANEFLNLFKIRRREKHINQFPSRFSR